MIECSLAQECEGEQKASGATHRPCCPGLLSSPVLLSPLGFSASNPITGAEALAYWGALMPALEGVRHLSGVFH